MKKIKKALALSLALAMGLSLVACGDKKDDGTTAAPDTSATGGDTTAPEPDNTDEPAPAATGIEAPSTDGWDASKKIYAYSWDDDFKKKLDIVLEAYPQYKDYVDYNILGISGTGDEYKTAIDTALENGDKYPSLIPADNDVAKYWSEDDSKTMNLRDLGFTDEVLSNSYDFAKQYGTYNGQLKAVTWQGCPGSVFYKRDIAKEVLGSDDPDTVQAALADWDKFFETADKMKEAGYYIVSGPDEVKYPMWDSQTQPWVTDDGSAEKLTLDSAVTDYLEMTKKLHEGEYTTNTSMWTWGDNMTSDGKVFCWFGCPWFINSMKDAGAVPGEWGACVGPVGYHWGGTYVMVGKDTPNPELCAFLLYELTCDPDIGVKICNQYGDFVNNKAANDRLAAGELASDNAALEFLGGQDPIATWAAGAAAYDASNVTYNDSTIKGYIDEAATGYREGTIATVDDAVKYIEDKAQTELGISAQ